MKFMVVLIWRKNLPNCDSYYPSFWYQILIEILFITFVKQLTWIAVFNLTVQTESYPEIQAFL